MNEASEKRKAAAARKAAQRAKIKSSETEEEKVQRNLREAKRQAEYRAKETPQQTQIRLKRIAEQAASRRSIETPQQTQIRSKRKAEQAAIRRSIETPEQTIVRLENVATRAAVRRTTGTVEETQVRLQQYQTYYGRKKFKKYYPRHELPTNLFDQFGEFENSENSDNSTFADPLDGIQPDVIPKISEKIEVYQSAKTAFMHLMKTKIGPDEEIPENLLDIIENSLSTPQENVIPHLPIYDQIHQANVCVICDRYITGINDLYWIKKKTLLSHHARLCIPTLDDQLKQCYQVIDPDLHHLVLSPRARVKKNGDYLCCSQCERALRNDRLDKNPPKFAIANNFAIGSLPKNLLSLVTDVTSPLLSPVRPFAYILSYSGGAHKVITGSFSFFNQSIEKNIGALNFHRQSTNSNNVYVVISGNFTPNQRQIIRTRCTVDVSQFNEIYTWLRGHNPTFSVMPEISNCPSPFIIEDDSSSDDEPKNPNLESQVEIQYWFPNNGNPTGPNSVFYSQTALVDALINSKEPTLIFTSTNYQPDYKLTLPMVFPLHFPFGVGGIEDVRRTPVSIEEILKYYLNISLPLFQRSDIILVICHIYFRRKSFQSAYLKCMSKSSQNGHTTGEYLSNITESEIIELSKKKKNEINGQIGATSTRLIHSVTAACKSIPYSDEAAKEARTKLFSMWYNFGPPAVFFTISPGDECNFALNYI